MNYLQLGRGEQHILRNDVAAKDRENEKREKKEKSLAREEK